MVTTIARPFAVPERDWSGEIAVAEPAIDPDGNGVVDTSKRSSNGASTQASTHCPRCGTRLRINYHEPQCLQCGYMDYSYEPPHSTNGRKSIVSAGTRYVLRYVGDFRSLAETLTYVKLIRVRNRVVYSVVCPFCHEAMVQSSLSGKRRELREERYKCAEGHRVSLTPNGNSTLGWK